MFATTRRRVLAGGLASGALLALGGGLAWVGTGYRLRAREAAIGLSVKELCVVRAIVETLLPAAEGLPSGVDVGVHQRIDEEVWASPDGTQDELRAALHLLEHSPPLFGEVGRLTHLEPAARVRAFERMLRSDVDVVVQAAASLKQLAHLFYFGSPVVWPHIGYDGPFVQEAKPPASSVRYAELLARRVTEVSA